MNPGKLHDTELNGTSIQSWVSIVTGASGCLFRLCTWMRIVFPSRIWNLRGAQCGKGLSSVFFTSVPTSNEQRWRRATLALNARHCATNRLEWWRRQISEHACFLLIVNSWLAADIAYTDPNSKCHWNKFSNRKNETAPWIVTTLRNVTI